MDPGGIHAGAVCTRGACASLLRGTSAPSGRPRGPTSCGKRQRSVPLRRRPRPCAGLFDSGCPRHGVGSRLGSRAGVASSASATPMACPRSPRSAGLFHCDGLSGTSDPGRRPGGLVTQSTDGTKEYDSVCGISRPWPGLPQRTRASAAIGWRGTPLAELATAAVDPRDAGAACWGRCRAVADECLSLASDCGT